MTFSFAVELLNMRMRKKKKLSKPVELYEPKLDESNETI
jgi:hypothetical protein